ncbi:MAG: SigE family RNA polymerase sigma factor [Actinomycetota bacterium]
MNSVDRSTSDRCDPELIGQYLGIAEDEPRAVESFDDFYRREYRSVVGLAFALGGSAAASEELAQDAFAAAFRNWGRISGYDRPEQWVRRVLVNNCRSRGRRLAAELRAMTRLRGRRERLPELTEPDHEFWAAVRALPERQSQSVALHYLEDRPVDEIAEILGCTTGTVKQHLHRGRRALAATLGLAGPDGPGGHAVGGPAEETGAGPVSGTAPADGNDGANGSAG